MIEPAHLPADCGDIPEIEVVFGQPFFQNRTVVPEASAVTFCAPAAVGDHQVHFFRVFFRVFDIFRRQTVSGVFFYLFKSRTAVPDLDISLAFLFLKIIQFPRIVDPDGSGGHMIDERRGIGADEEKLSGKSRIRTFTDPVKPVRQLLPQDLFRDIAGIVSKTVPVEITEHDLVLLHGAERENLPAKPDESFVQRQI